MRIACVTYRDWALSIYDSLAAETDHTCLIIRSKAQYDERALRDFQPDFILFYGWSWLIGPELIRDFRCLMLHPSPLPKYRGGSPLQNQIIRGEKMSAVTIFHMNDEVDAGDILEQEPFSLEGTLDEIFGRISQIGLRLTRSILAGAFHPKPQDHSSATVYKRRKPAESEITLEELRSRPAEYLHDKIRMLADPYPNAFIRTADNKKLRIKDSSIEDA